MTHDLLTALCQKLRDGKAVAVATIATSDGSTPRGAGAKMLADDAGLVAGTLGGGAAEAQALVEAKACLADGRPRLFAVDMAGSAASGADLICGGTVEIFIQRLDRDSLETFTQLLERLNGGLDSFLLTPVEAAEGQGAPCLIFREEDIPAFSVAGNEHGDGARLVVIDGQRHLLETVAAPYRLILAGGGHVSLATARVAGLVGFDTTVIDDRPEFVAPERFPWLPRRRLLATPDFRDCLSDSVLGFRVEPRCCIAILTRGHSFDSEVLAQALRTPAGYIGMIGSRRKREAVYAGLLARGFDRDDLGRVRSPIGLDIGGDTPEEIAVSIVAELIAHRARHGGGE